jgi:hypothetical protein
MVLGVANEGKKFFEVIEFLWILMVVVVVTCVQIHGTVYEKKG